MSTYNIIAASNESTVVAEYTPENSRSDCFQSEAALEKEFIRLLTTQGYEYLTIHDENGLIANLRQQLTLLTPPFICRAFRLWGIFKPMSKSVILLGL